MTAYKLPDTTRIGHIHLKVSDLERSIAFYCETLGFREVMRMGNEAAFVAAGDYHHHIGLNTWYSESGSPPAEQNTGLFHAAIVLPGRKDLARVLQRLREIKYPIEGAADHGVSEAIYLRDPDQNGLEIYWDRPREEWPRDEHGDLTMYTRPLKTENLLGEL